MTSLHTHGVEMTLLCVLEIQPAEYILITFVAICICSKHQYYNEQKQKPLLLLLSSNIDNHRILSMVDGLFNFYNTISFKGAFTNELFLRLQIGTPAKSSCVITVMSF